MNIIEKIQTIFQHIKLVNDEPAANTGISEAEVVSHFNSIGRTPTTDLIQLYEWHNGIYNLDAFLSLLSVNDAIERYKGNKSLKKDIPEFEWKESWLTVLDMNGDVQICLDLGTNELYSVDIECDLVQKIADNFEHYVDAILSIFEEDKFSFDEEAGCVDVKDDVWNGILKKYNIKSAWE